MAWRANANAARAVSAGNNVATPSKNVAARTKPTVQAIAQIEKNREDRRRAMAAAKKERERENLANEKRGQPGDVDFQRMIKTFREQNSDKKLPHASAGETKITICVRKRPVSQKEVKKRDHDAVTCLNPMAIVHDCKLKVDGITKYLDNNAFGFDHTFDENTSNETVYKYTAQPLVKFVFQDRGRATVFAYGQTGSGKTHTMQGIQKQIADDVFAQLYEFERQGITLDACVSFFEIYGGRCQDLLHRKKCTILEDGKGQVQIVDLEEVRPRSVDELLQIIEKGNSLRTTHATEMNDVSSRSHCICQIIIRDRNSGKLHGKLSLIDLAGSERGEDTKNHSRQRRMESSEINKSLLALKECFRALDSGGRNAHIPFRASKLTQVLKDSFVNAKARTVMIAAVSPVSSSSDHTLNTLRYADRVKEKQVSADVFDESTGVDLGDVSLETDEDDGNASPLAEDSIMDDMPDEYQDGEQIDDYEYENEEDELRRPQRSNSASSQEDIKLLHDNLRRHSRGSSGANEDDYDLEALHGVVQTLYEDQESLLNAHMNAIQESAELLTEEGALLAEIQGDSVIDYDIDRYVSRLDEILAQKAATIEQLQKQLTAFRKRCEEEENASKKIKEVQRY
ncbi:hypothetical protein Poli38472_006132 [Pythium oligandrum]|uniref:Kinesin-like protein n=1 Tax=Pythium oligandrum TaxID=41045 RepID=A0A8K1CSB9_PYTOL|nr:hypothetical protein Poli38472_006132 [Pythium oligandrum]|eukprot:TMW68664.1 hypothetical protein Poli38472_006132 [Pythium oligandrum]